MYPPEFELITTHTKAKRTQYINIIMCTPYAVKLTDAGMDAIKKFAGLPSAPVFTGVMHTAKQHRKTERQHIALQKAINHAAKGHLLEPKRQPFAKRYQNFSNSSYIRCTGSPMTLKKLPVIDVTPM